MPETIFDNTDIAIPPVPPITPAAEPVGESVAEPAAEPVAESVAEPVTDIATEPAAEPTTARVVDPDAIDRIIRAAMESWNLTSDDTCNTRSRIHPMGPTGSTDPMPYGDTSTISYFPYPNRPPSPTTINENMPTTRPVAELRCAIEGCTSTIPFGSLLCRAHAETHCSSQCCGKLFPKHELHALWCESCFKDNPQLASWSGRIYPELKGENGRHFGAELEIELDDYHQLTKVVRGIFTAVGRDVLCKHDGSLNRGLELVTKPLTLDLHRELWTKLLLPPPKGWRSFNTTTCGLHVHAERTGLSENEIARIVCFVNAPRNKNFIHVIAGRSAPNYAALKRKIMADAHVYSGSRYEAVNLANKHTIEFRIFKGTTKVPSLMKAIEFCDALIEFAKVTPTARAATSKLKFLSFLRDNEERWPYLYGYIRAKWQGVENAMAKSAGWKPVENFSKSSPVLPTISRNVL